MAKKQQKPMMTPRQMKSMMDPSRMQMMTPEQMPAAHEGKPKAKKKGKGKK